MYFYNFKVAFRNLIRQKGISLINIFGLAIGISCSILLFLMVFFSYTTDQFQVNYENLFLFQQKVSVVSGDFTSDRAGGALGPALAENYPQIQSYTRMGQLGEMLLAYYPDGKEGGSLPITFIEKGGAAVDSTFFNVFSFDFIYGGPPQGILRNDFIYLTKEVSEKLFQKEDPTDKTVYFQEGLALTVAGVLDEIPKNSSVQFSYLVPFKVEEMIGMPVDGFGGTLYHNYFVLDDPGSAALINENINEFLDTKYDEEIISDRFLTHIREVYLFGENHAAWGIFIFGLVGLGVLLVASINYINLTTAKSIDRAREVGIRKTGGAKRSQLIIQFLSESLLITLISVNVAILLTELTLPYINTTFESDLAIPYQSLYFWIFITILILSVGVLAGFYPAFTLSSFHPSLIFRNFIGGKSRGAALRKVLVVSQFSITLFFIICTVFLFKQVSYIDTADLGINKENLIYIPTRGKLWNKFDEIKTEILNESSVRYVTTVSELPNNVNHGEINWGREKEKQNAIARILWCGDDLIETFGMEMAHGRFYNTNIQSDIDEGIIINEEILKMLKYEGNPIGQRFRLWEEEKTIIGVVKDFTFFPIDVGAKAIILPYRNINQFIFIKTTVGTEANSLARIENIIRKHNPEYPFEYYLLSDFKNPSMASSGKLLTVMFYFSLFGIFISCLGIFGLTLFTIEKRTKEIGIRKVFGASIPRITLLLSQGFIKLVFIANIIALPLAYFTLKGILSFFVVKINLSPSVFIETCLAVLTMAWITVFWQSVKVARKNPANSLRYE